MNNSNLIYLEIRNIFNEYVGKVPAYEKGKYQMIPEQGYSFVHSRDGKYYQVSKSDIIKYGLIPEIWWS